MTLEKLITSGSDNLIHKSAETSKMDPHVAIAQLLLAAAVLAYTVDMTDKDFRDGVDLAITDVWFK